MELKNIVMELIGPVNPVGDSAIDEERLKNLKMLCTLTNYLVAEIDNVAHENQYSHEASVKRAVRLASNFLTKTLGDRGVNHGKET